MVCNPGLNLLMLSIINLISVKNTNLNAYIHCFRIFDTFIFSFSLYHVYTVYLITHIMSCNLQSTKTSKTENKIVLNPQQESEQVKNI